MTAIGGAPAPRDSRSCRPGSGPQAQAAHAAGRPLREDLVQRLRIGAAAQERALGERFTWAAPARSHVEAYEAALAAAGA